MSKLKIFIKYFPPIVIATGSLLILILLIAIFSNVAMIVKLEFTLSIKCDVDIINCLNTCDNRKICNLNITLMEPLFVNHTNNIYLVNIPSKTNSGIHQCYFNNKSTNMQPVLDNWLNIYPLLNMIKILIKNIIIIFIIITIFGIIPIMFIKCIKKMNPINIIRNML